MSVLYKLIFIIYINGSINGSINRNITIKTNNTGKGIIDVVNVICAWKDILWDGVRRFPNDERVAAVKYIGVAAAWRLKRELGGRTRLLAF